MTTSRQFHQLGKIIAGKLYDQLATLAREHGVNMKEVAEHLNAGVFDISATLPGDDGGPFEGSKFKLTLSLMPAGHDEGRAAA
jgi:hypothetical protein